MTGLENLSDVWINLRRRHPIALKAFLQSEWTIGLLAIQQAVDKWHQSMWPRFAKGLSTLSTQLIYEQNFKLEIRIKLKRAFGLNWCLAHFCSGRCRIQRCSNSIDKTKSFYFTPPPPPLPRHNTTVSFPFLLQRQPDKKSPSENKKLFLKCFLQQSKIQPCAERTRSGRLHGEGGSRLLLKLQVRIVELP